MISTDQGMHERRVAFFGVQSDLRPEGIGVIVQAHAILGGKAGTKISRDPEGIIEIPRPAEIKSTSVDTTF